MTGRARRRSRDPDRRPLPPEERYVLALPGMLGCAGCGVLLLDAAAAREAHDRFHAALRALWANGNGRGGSEGG